MTSQEKIFNIIEELLRHEIKFQQELVRELKYAIDNHVGTEQVEFIQNTLEQYTNALFTAYEFQEKILYKKYNLDYTNSFSYNYMQGRIKFWETYGI
jgi:hypothetical protein